MLVFWVCDEEFPSNQPHKKTREGHINSAFSDLRCTMTMKLTLLPIRVQPFGKAFETGCKLSVLSKKKDLIREKNAIDT